MKPYWTKFSNLAKTFFLEPASARPLAVLRISVAAVLLLQAFLIAPEFFEFFGRNGILQESLSKFFAEPFTPRLGPAVAFLAKYGISERAVLGTFGSLYIASLILLMVGAFTRPAAVIAWFCHWVFMSSSFCSNYGADIFAHIFLFYLIVVPAGEALSVDSWRYPRERATWYARLSLRLVQLHLCLVYLSSAIEKAPGPQWHDGEIMWRSLNLPVYYQFDFTWLANYPWLAKGLGWQSLAVEMLYCVFIWPKATRKLWVFLTVSLHLGIAVFLGLHIFGLIMAALTWSAFGWSAEPQAARAREPEFTGTPVRVTA